MRRTMVGMCTASALLLSACGGSSGGFQNRPRPPIPVNLSVYVNDARVSVSPSAVGAGPVVFIVTNAARQTESVTVQSADGSRTLASTGPINPQTTAQVTVDFRQPGDYQVATGRNAGSLAQEAQPGAIRAAPLRIGRPRASASNALLQP
jgi:hypothetical protein